MPMFPKAIAYAGLAAVLAAAVAMPATAATRVAGAAQAGAPAPPPGGPPATEDPGEAAREAREALKAGDFDAPTAAWREGPVRYLLTSKEDLIFRRLGSRED